MSDYDAPQFGLGPGPDAFDWRARPAVAPDPETLTNKEKNRIRNRANMRAKRAATPQTLAAPLPSKYNRGKPLPDHLARPAFNVHIATADESRRTNSIK